uniref:Anaphase-promoting complex subunit 4 WD40 domain-containing protein n=1 Tax=Globisporangium ultimum (strain ATCC 200006 / CBS 805.95 / DAOM BR144) TaxID=431595 RepID=K3X1P7_GLOUD
MQRQSKGIDPELFTPSANAAGSAYGYTAKPPDTSSYYYYNNNDAYGYTSTANSNYRHQHATTTIELEHVSGYTGKGKSTIHAHPSDPESFITCMGAAVVVGNVHETHNQRLLRGHDEEINVLSMSNTGAFDQGAVIVVWDLNTQRDLYRLLGFQRAVLHMTFSPDDHFLAASSEDCRVIIWDMRTSKVVLSKSFPTPVTILNWGQMDEKCRRPKYTLTFAHSSQLLFGELAYDISCMQYKLEIATFHMPNLGPTRSYLCATMTASRSELLAGTMAGELVVFNVDTQVYRNAIPVSRNGVHSIACCRATGFVYIGAGDGVLKKLVGRDSEWSVVGQVQLVGGIASLSISSDGSQLFAGTSAGKMYHIVANTLVPTELASSHLGSIMSCTFGDSNEEFATISIDGSLRVWNLSTYELKCMATEAARGLSIVFAKKMPGNSSSSHASSSIVVSGWADGWIRAYDAMTAQKKWHIANAHRGEVTSVATSDKYVVSGASDGGVSIWSAQTRELVLQFHEHKRGVAQVLVDVGKPHWIHSCGLDKALFIYDLKSERRIVAQQVRDGAFNSITQRLDSETEIITAGSDGRLLFWDCDVADPVQSILEPSRLRVAYTSVSPSGRFLATCGEDCEVKIYDLGTLALLTTGQGHSDTVNCVAWSPDERQIVSVGSDSCISVWNFYQDET